MTLAAIVVFTTTYAMILPALSMDVVVAQQDSGIGLENENTADFSSEAQTDADTGTGSAGRNTDTGEAQTPTAADTDSASIGTEPETDDDFSTEEPAVVEQQTTADAAASTLTAEIPGATVTLAFDPEAGVPEGTILTVTALTQEEAGAYGNATQEKADASVSGSTVTTAQFYRLALTHDGETVTPAGDADIHVDYAQNPYLEQDETAYAVIYTGEASSYHTLLLSRNSDGTATVAVSNGAITAADLKDYSISRYGDVFGIVSVKAPAAENGDEAGADDNAAADTTEDTAAEAEKNSKETVDAADDIDAEKVNDNLAAKNGARETDAAAEEGNTAEDEEAAEEQNAAGDAAEVENTIEDENAGEEKDAAEEVTAAADETDAQDADSQDTEKESEDFDAPESLTEEDAQAGLTELDLGDVVIRPVDEELLLPADTEGHAEVLEGTEAAEAQSAVEEFVNAQNAPKASKMKKAAKRQTLAAATATADQNEQAYQVFDIALENVDTEEYKGGFEVEVSLPENIIGKDFHLYHIHEGETEEIAFDLDERVLDEESGVSVVSGFTFETANFSEFVLKYTVDFEYNGYMFSMPGDGVMLLSDLLEELHINADVADVENVTFTDGNLLSVEKMQQATTYYALYMARYGVDGSEDEATVEGSNKYVDLPIAAGDWVIASLNPFETVEELTVLLSDGTEYAIAVTDPQGDGGVWTLIKGETATSIDAAVSTSIQETDQERNVSFRATMSYEVTSGTLTAMKSYHGGFPTLVYDLTEWVESAPATISNATGAIKDENDEQVGTYEIKDNKVYLTFDNLTWLSQQDSLKGTFKLTINVDETKVGADDEWHLDLPGTSSDVKVPFKKVDFNTSKTVSFDGTKEDGKGAFVTKGEDGYYYMNYTATFKTPVDLKNLTFKDTLSGGQELTGDVTITDPNGTTTTVSITKPGVDETTFSFAVPQNMNEAENPNKVKAGTYTVNYQTRVSEEYVKYYNASDVATQANDAAWKVEGKKDDVPGGHTEEKIVKEPPTPGEEKVTKTVDKTSAQPGDILHYEVTFGEGENPSQNKAATDLSEAVISDYMTDTQKLTGNIQISYDGGTTWQNMPAAGSDWAGGVVWNNDNQYSANNTDLFRFKLPKGTTGPVKVKYDTQVISKDEAIASNLWGTTMADNYAKVNNTTEWTHTTVVTPEEPDITKTVTGNAGPKTGETGETWAYEKVLTYTLTYGSDDVKVGGTTITDTMTALQNLNSDVVITLKDGTTITMPVDGSNGVVWNKDNYTPGTEPRTLFNYTFPSQYDNVYGEFTVTYTTKVLTKDQAEKILNLFGKQDVYNTFTVNGRNAQTIGHVDTQEPVEVHKVVNDQKNITAKPGDTVTYTVTFGKPGEDMGYVRLYDQMTDIQAVVGKISITFGNDSTGVEVDPLTNAADATYGNYWVNVLDYEVPEGKTGVVTVTYQAKLADKNVLNNLGYYETQHAYNHASSSKGGSDDTDITVDYGKKPDYHLEKTGEIDTDSGTTGWSAGDRIKWTVTYGDSSTDMRGMVMQDTMQFTQKLDETFGVEVKVGTADAFKLEPAADRWNSEGVLYRTDDNVNQDAYGLWTEVPVFKYTVPSNSDTPVLGPVVVTYYTTLLNEGEAWAKDITGIQQVYNKAGLGDKWITDPHDTDFGTPPVPTKTAYTGETKAAAEANTTAHIDGAAYDLGSYVTYELTFGNQYEKLDNLPINDFMTEIQTLVGDVTMTYGGKTVNMPVATSADTGVTDGVKWNLVHTDGVYSDQMKCVFAYKFPEDSGNGPVVIRYTVKLMTNDEALTQGLVKAMSDINTLSVNGTQATHTGTVTPKVPDTPPTKTVSNVQGNASTAWQPGDTLNYTITYGYGGQWINNPQALTIIYDQMTNLQKLVPGVDNSGVKVTYYTDPDGAESHKAYFYMPIAGVENYNNGVRWTNPTATNSYTTDMKDVFNFTFPKEDETRPDSDSVLMGRVYGPITVEYSTTIISAQEALDSQVWGSTDVKNNFMNVANTTGTVPFPGQPTHDGEIKKTAYVSKGDRSPVYGVNPDSGVPEGVVSDVSIRNHEVTWHIYVGPAEGSSYPLSHMKVIDNGGQTVQVNESGYAQYYNTAYYLQYSTAKVVGYNSKNVYTPGVDYQYLPSENGWYFETLNEPIVIEIKAAFPYEFMGDYWMTNGATLWWDGSHATTDAKVTGTVEDIVVSKNGDYDEDTGLIKWTVVLNPTWAERQPDLAKVIFKDDLPKGLQMLNYDDKTTTNPSIYVEYLGTVVQSNQNQKLIVDVDENGHFETDVTPYNDVAVQVERTSLKWVYEEVTYDQYIKDYNGQPFYETKWEDNVCHYVVPTYFEWDGAISQIVSHDMDLEHWEKSKEHQKYFVHIQKNVTETVTEYEKVAAVGVNKQKYQITYYTKIADDEWPNVTSSETGSKTYENKSLFTDGDTVSWSGTGEETVTAKKPLNKFELKDNNTNPGDPMEDPNLDLNTKYYWYEIDINKDREQLTKEIDGSLQILKITDYIDPKIDIVQSKVKLYQVEPDGTKIDTATLTGADKPTIQYNDDSRMLVVDNLQDKTYYVLQYRVKVRALWTEGMDESEYTITNTVNLEGNKKWSDSTTGKHKVQLTDAGVTGSMHMLKVDENDITKLLEGAEIEIYEQPTNVSNIVSTYDDSTKKVTVTYDGDGKFDGAPIQQGTTFTSDENGKITLTGISSFKPNTLYYWIETKAPEVPEGEDPYIENREPHYFVIYAPGSDEDGRDTAKNRETAWTLDNAWTSANKITVASMSSDTEWIINNSRLRSIAITKSWEADYNNLYKTRPDSITVNLIQIDWQGNRNVLKSTKLMPNEEGKWDDYTNYIWTGLPVAEPGHPDHQYTYTVEEENVPGYFAVYSDGQKGIKTGKISITNQLIPSKTDIVIEKKWEGDTTNLPDSISVTLMQILKDEDGNVGNPRPATSIPGYVVTLQRNPETNKWTYEWKDLPTKDGQGGTYTYTVQETVPAGYKVTYSDDNRGVLESTDEDPLVITNTAVGKLKVTKRFAGINGNSLTPEQKQAIVFTVTNSKGETVATFTYADMLGGEKLIEDLPVGTYTVTEGPVDASAPEGYTWISAECDVTEDNVAVARNETAAVTYTNTYEPKAFVQVTKTFAGTGFTADKIPEGFKITANWTENEDSKTVDLTVTGDQPEGVTLTGDFPTYTWTIRDLPKDIKVTFTETGYDPATAGTYTVVTEKKSQEDEDFELVNENARQATATTANDGTGVAAFRNTYNELTWIKVRKQWVENEHPTDTPSTGQTSIQVQLWRGTEQLNVNTGEPLMLGDTANAVKTLIYGSETANQWLWTLTGLRKYNDAGVAYNYHVVEVDPTDWNTEYSKDGGEHRYPTAVTAAVPGEGTITIFNSKYTVSLPATGGVGTGIIYGAGAALLLLAVLGLILLNRKRTDGEGIR